MSMPTIPGIDPDINIKRKDGGDIGGGVHVTIGNFTMATGTVIQYCFVNSFGGGIYTADAFYNNTN